MGKGVGCPPICSYGTAQEGSAPAVSATFTALLVSIQGTGHPDDRKRALAGCAKPFPHGLCCPVRQAESGRPIEVDEWC